MHCAHRFLRPVLLLLAGATLCFSQQTKINIAVMTLKAASGISEGEAELITERLNTELFRTGKVNVMERNQMQEILKEQGFQQSGACTDEACLVEVGQLLGVQGLITGSIGKLGSLFLVNLRIIDVRTAQIRQVVSEDIKGDVEDVVGRLSSIARRLLTKPGETAPPPAQIAQESQPEPVVAEEEEQEEEEVEVAVVEVDDDSDEQEQEDIPAGKNDNRSGLRLHFSLYGTTAEYRSGSSLVDLYEDYSIKEFSEGLDSELDPNYVAYHLRLGVDFLIRAGNSVLVSVGPGILLYGETAYWEDYTANQNFISYQDEFSRRIVAPGAQVSVVYTKRWHPVKISAGLVGAFNIAIVSTTLDLYSSTESDVGVASMFGVGPTVAFELLPSPKFGFYIDTHYLFNNTATVEFSSWKYESVGEISLPGFGFTASINWYW
jgi:curli biogenesis system outer membrane secretion channel CsgG